MRVVRLAPEDATVAKYIRHRLGKTGIVVSDVGADSGEYGVEFAEASPEGGVFDVFTEWELERET